MPAKPIKTVVCDRCGAKLCIDPRMGSLATMLKRAKAAKGYCVHCAVHDWLRHTYPINIQLAESGPAILLHPQIRQLFGEIMRGQHADAHLDEINWNLIVENWELPWSEPMRTLPTNPVTQEELDDIKSGKRPGLSSAPPPPDPLGGKMTITSFEDLNLLQPGLGDGLRRALHDQLDQGGRKEVEAPSKTENVKQKPDAPDVQKELF